MLLALSALRQATKILCVSSAWRASALGTHGPDFFNAVVKVEIELFADNLKYQVLRPIELRLGRQRSANKNAPRTIDLDILLFNDEVIDPHIWDYAYLAVPLAECYSQLRNPPSKKTILLTAQELQKSKTIRRTNLFDEFLTSPAKNK